MEGAGEDTYLGSLIATTRVQGFQGTNLTDSNSIAACAKHFAAYGFGIAGREYNTFDISQRTLVESILPPFQAAANAGVATYMSSFNEINWVPSTANAYLLNTVLRKQWGFYRMLTYY